MGGDVDDDVYDGHHGDNLSNKADYSEWWMDDDDHGGHRIDVEGYDLDDGCSWSRGAETFSYRPSSSEKKAGIVRDWKNERESEKEGER